MMRSFVLLSVMILMIGVNGFIHPPVSHNSRSLFGVTGTEKNTFSSWTRSFQKQRKGLQSTEMPTGDDFDDAYEYFDKDGFMQDLRLRIEKSEVLGPGIENRPKPRDVYIILFEPDTDDEGVHTIEFPKGSGNHVILAFESLSQCELFADTLRNQQFFDPEPTEILLRDLEEYCDPLGVQVQVVPKGTSLVPPSDAAETLDHNPYLNQQRDELENIFDLTYEPEEGTTTGSIETFSDNSYGSWE